MYMYIYIKKVYVVINGGNVDQRRSMVVKVSREEIHVSVRL